MARPFGTPALALWLTLGCASGTPHAEFSGNEIELAGEAEPDPPPPPPKWCPKDAEGCEMPAEADSSQAAASDEPLDPDKRYTVDVYPDDPRKGPPTAPVTLVVFSDFQCPYCQRLTMVLAELVMRYPAQVQVVWKDLPLVGHEFALPAALMAREAYAKGGSRRFWEVHDALFMRQNDFSSETLANIAQRFDLSWPPLDQHQAHIDETYQQVLRLNVRSTPTVFVNGRPLVGVKTLDEYEEVIDEELAGRPK